jgi:ATP-dependent Lon protease
LPKENEADLTDLPEEVRRTLDVHVVEDLDEVLTVALRGAKFESGHLVFDGPAPVEPQMVAKKN